MYTVRPSTRVRREDLCTESEEWAEVDVQTIEDHIDGQPSRHHLREYPCRPTRHLVHLRVTIEYAS